MITVNGEKPSREFFWKYNIAYNMLSIQDVVDALSSLKDEIPKERELSNIPFGLIGKDGRPHILFGDSKENHLVWALHKALPILIDFSEGTGIVVAKSSDLYKELEALEKENSELKDRLSKVKKLIENNKEDA